MKFNYWNRAKSELKKIGIEIPNYESIIERQIGKRLKLTTQRINQIKKAR